MSEKLSLAILKARVASCDGKVIILSDSKILAEIGFSEIVFFFGEIQSVKTHDGKKLQRGMVVNVHHKNHDGVAVIVGFIFGTENYPIIISWGGAEGELIMYVRANELSFFPSQVDGGKTVILSVE